MSAFLTELKCLISRLAKKEVKLALARGKGLRRENQSLRARVKSLESNLQRMIRTITKSGIGVAVPNPGEDGDLKRLRLTAKGIKTLRRKTRLSQSKFAKLVGASTISVSNWELGKSLPRKSADAFRRMLEIRNNKMGSREARRTLEAMGNSGTLPVPVPTASQKVKRNVKGKGSKKSVRGKGKVRSKSGNRKNR